MTEGAQLELILSASKFFKIKIFYCFRGNSYFLDFLKIPVKPNYSNCFLNYFSFSKKGLNTKYIQPWS